MRSASGGASLGTGVAGPRFQLRGWSDARRSLALAVVVVLIASVLLFLRLGSQPLVDWDESVYAQVSKEMIQTGDWLTTHWGGSLFFDKPPLYMWVEGSLFQTFGISELAARAPSALSGVGLILLTFLVGSKTYNKAAGLVASLALLSTYGFLFYARFATLDVMLTFFCMLAVYGYVRARDGRPRWWYVVAVALGLAVMTKGAAAAAPAAGMVIGLLFDRQARASLTLPSFVGSFIAFVLVAAPWHAYMYLVHGQAFFAGYIGQIVVAKIAGGIPSNREGVFYYFSVLGHDFYPWLFFLPLAFAFGIAHALKRSSPSIVFIAMTVLVFGLYTSSPVKLSWYMEPLYPPAAILIGGFLTNTLWPVRVTAGLAALAAVAATLLASVSVGLNEVVTLRVGYLLVVLVACLALAGIWNLVRPPVAVWRVIPVLVVFLLVASANSARPAFATTPEPVVALARVAGTTSVADRDPIYLMDHWPSVLFYSGRPVEFLPDPTELIARLPVGVPSRAILLKDMTARMSACCDLEIRTESDAYVYVLVTRRATAR